MNASEYEDPPTLGERVRVGTGCLLVLIFLAIAFSSIFQLFPPVQQLGELFRQRYDLFLAVTVGALLLICVPPWLAWIAERLRVRKAIVEELRRAGQSDGAAHLGQQVLALVPCRGNKLQADLAPLADGGPLWLCFLSDRLLVISGRGGKAVLLAREQLQLLRLVYQSSGTARGYALVLETSAGRSVLIVRYLADLARIVNVLIRQDVKLGSLRV